MSTKRQLLKAKILTRKGSTVRNWQFLLLPLDPDSWSHIFFRIRIQEAKMLRIQQIRILLHAQPSPYLLISAINILAMIVINIKSGFFISPIIPRSDPKRSKEIEKKKIKNCRLTFLKQRRSKFMNNHKIFRFFISVQTIPLSTKRLK